YVRAGPTLSAGQHPPARRCAGKDARGDLDLGIRLALQTRFSQTDPGILGFDIDHWVAESVTRVREVHLDRCQSGLDIHDLHEPAPADPHMGFVEPGECGVVPDGDRRGARGEKLPTTVVNGSGGGY